MADITATEVDYTLRGQFPVTVPGVVRRQWEILFPNAGAGAKLRYPTGGIPLLVKSLGYPTVVTSLRVIGRTPNAGVNLDPRFEWDGNVTAPKLVAFEDGAATKMSQQKANAADDFVIATPVKLVIETEGY